MSPASSLHPLFMFLTSFQNHIKPLMEWNKTAKVVFQEWYILSTRILEQHKEMLKNAQLAISTYNYQILCGSFVTLVILSSSLLFSLSPLLSLFLAPLLSPSLSSPSNRLVLLVQQPTNVQDVYVKIQEHPCLHCQQDIPEENRGINTHVFLFMFFAISFLHPLRGGGGGGEERRTEERRGGTGEMGFIGTSPKY